MAIERTRVGLEPGEAARLRASLLSSLTAGGKASDQAHSPPRLPASTARAGPSKRGPDRAAAAEFRRAVRAQNYYRRFDAAGVEAPAHSADLLATRAMIDSLDRQARFDSLDARAARRVKGHRDAALAARIDARNAGYERAIRAEEDFLVLHPEYRDVVRRFVNELRARVHMGAIQGLANDAILRENPRFAPILRAYATRLQAA